MMLRRGRWMPYVLWLKLPPFRSERGEGMEYA